MKTLILLFMLSPVAAFANADSNTDTAANSTATHSYYHGTGTKHFADGSKKRALISLTMKRMGASDRDGVFFIYHKVMDGKDYNYVIFVKQYGSDDGVGFYKVFVPTKGSNQTGIDENSVTNLDMQEAGWGHMHQYRGRHGYTKHSFFLSYNAGNMRVDHNIFIKTRDDGSQRIYSKVSAGGSEGLDFVWTDKMKLVFNAP